MGRHSHSAPVTESRPCGRLLFVALMAVLVWLPLPLGSNRPWAWSLMEVLVFSLGLWWIALFWLGRVGVTAAFLRARPALLLLIAFPLIPLAQIAPLPEGMLELISPHAWALHRAAMPLGEGQGWTLSVSPDDTLEFLLKSLSYTTLFALILLVVNSERRVRAALVVLLISGVAHAVYGAVESMLSHMPAHGAYVNRNHLAGYLEMCLALGTGIVVSGGVQETWTNRQRLRELIRWVISPRIGVRVLLVAMVIGLVLTQSRMGNTAFFSSLLVTGAVWMAFQRGTSLAVAGILVASIVLVDVYLVGSWFGFDEVVTRIQQTSLAGDTRVVVNRDMMGYLRDFALIGSGGGSFYTLFPSYRGTDGMDTYFLHAHNDYFELAAEVGAPGIAILGGVMALSLWAAVEAMRRRRTGLFRGIGFGAFMGMTAILIHSTTDFNLQIPANAATFMFLVAMAWIARGMERGRRPARSAHRHGLRHRTPPVEPEEGEAPRWAPPPLPNFDLPHGVKGWASEPAEETVGEGSAPDDAKKMTTPRQGSEGAQP